MQTILVIDDEIQICRLLNITLSANSYKVIQANNGKEGLLEIATTNPDLVILDLGLPDMDGHDVLLSLREWYSKPVIVLSVRNSEDDIIQALDGGANDYLTKPFRSGELLARIRVALRAGEKIDKNEVLQIGSLSIDLVSRSVFKNDKLLKLTATEYSLLSLFVRNQGRVLTHQYILKEVWGFGYVEQTQYLRVFIAQLRKKIEDNPSNPDLLVTESGVGYRFGK